MKITDIRIRLVNKEDAKLKAVASLTIEDSIVIHDIKIIDGREGLFISMPSRKTPDGKYNDVVHPIKNEVREALSSAVLSAYEDALKAE